MYVCTYVCMHVCMYVCLCMCMYVYMYVCVCVFMYVCMYDFCNVLMPRVASHKRYSPLAFESLLTRPWTGEIKKTESSVESRNKNWNKSDGHENLGG